MTRYRVIVSEPAASRIVEYAEYIAGQTSSWRIAEGWLEKVYDDLATLEYLPERFALAEESDRRPYEVRRLLIGNYLALYTIDEAERVVRIIGFRHGSRLPRPEDLPEAPGPP